MFFTFEGGEGAGKTSLIAALQMELTAKGFHVLVTREPGGTAIGKTIRKLLLDPSEQKMTKRAEILLFLADRAQHVEEVIRPFLLNKGIVLCDRFIDSTLAYQSDAIDINELIQLNLFATHALWPHKTYYLDLDPLIGMERVLNQRAMPLDRMEQKTLEFHKKVRNNFLDLCQRFPKRMLKVDATLSQQKVFLTVQQHMMSEMNEHFRNTTSSP